MKITGILKGTIFIGILIVFLSQCLLAQGNGVGNGIPDKTINLDEASKIEARNEYVKILKGFYDVPAYQVQTVLTQPGFVTITTTIDYLSPDRFRFIKESDVANVGKTKSEMLFIGKSKWIKNAAGAWQLNPDGADIVATLRNPNIIEGFIKNNRIDMQPVSSDFLNGQPMKVYQFTNNDVRQNISVTVKTWVSVKDNLPQKMISETRVDAEGKTQITMITTDYNYSVNIKIESPIQ